MQKLKNKKLPTNKKVKTNTGKFAMEGALFGLQIPLNLKDCINLRNGASKEVVKELDAMALEEMSSYSELHKQSGAINSPQGYVTREAKISCSYGKGYYVTMLDARKDYGVFAANGKPLLTCKDCLAGINIHSFGNCFAEIESGRKFPRLSGTRVGNVGGKWIYKCIPEPVGPWRQKESALQIGDTENEEHDKVLVSGAYLPCRYGGIIEIVEVPQNEQKREELKWIPSYILQIDGESEQEKKLRKRITEINDKLELKKSKDMENAEKYEGLKWKQEKIDKVWDACLEFYYDYEVQVDPRMLLAIIALEGTGSFNTSSENKAADGGNGAEFEFNKDCRRAVYLLGGKIIAYLRFHNEFSTARQAAYEKQRPGITDTDDILHYINWETPKLVLFETDAKFNSGGYAEDSHWHRKIRQKYSDFVDLDVEKKTQEYTNYVLTLDSHIFERAAEEMGIDINKEVLFKEAKNGKDENANPNEEYTIIGEII